jgi:hypothetical protein
MEGHIMPADDCQKRSLALRSTRNIHNDPMIRQPKFMLEIREQAEQIVMIKMSE